MVFAFPFRVVQTFAYIHFESPGVEPGRFTTANLKNDSRSCQTSGVSPAKPGDFPMTLRAADEFSESAIKKQVRRHWKQLNAIVAKAEDKITGA
jgi:hypothetical protein